MICLSQGVSIRITKIKEEILEGDLFGCEDFNDRQNRNLR